MYWNNIKKTKFHVARINTNVTLSHTISMVTCNVTVQFDALLFVSVFKGTFFIIFLSRISPCLLRMGCKTLYDYFKFDMHSNVKTPSPRDVTELQAGLFVRTGHWPINSRHVYQAGGNVFMHISYFIFPLALINLARQKHVLQISTTESF